MHVSPNAFVLLLLPLLGLAGRAPEASSAPPDTAPRNVVVILADDLGYGDLGFTGNPVLRTPHLDAMAQRSARMSAFYVHPFCGPTRAALLTGRYPHRSAVHFNGAELAPGALTLAEALRDAGWATGIFGKWHLGPHRPRRARDQGFEEALVTRGGLIGELAPVPGDIGRYTDPVFEHDGALVELEGYATGATFDAALAWIERMRAAERPFFAYLAPNVPHRPFDDVPRDRYASIRERIASLDPPLYGDATTLDEAARAYAMIEDLDETVGRFFERLEALELLASTLVVFLSDNGPNGQRFNGGYRGLKGHVTEGGLRTVFLAHLPGTLRAGHASDRIAAHIDLLPTVLEAVGVALPADHELDGRSLWPLLTEREVTWPDRALYFEGHKGDEVHPRHNYAVRTQDWKLVRAGNDLPMERFDGNAQNLAGAALYDLRNDPFEEHDLLAQERERALELRALYEVMALDMEREGKRDRPEGRVGVGHPDEDPVLLTHAHWNRLAPDGAGGERKLPVVQAQALMGLRSVGAARYDVVVRFAPASEDATVFLSLRREGKRKGSPIEREAPVAAGEREVRFEDVELAQARYDLLALMGPSRKAGRPVWQVELRRRR